MDRRFPNRSSILGESDQPSVAREASNPKELVERNYSESILPLQPSTFLHHVLTILVAILFPPLGSLAATDWHVTYRLTIDILLCLSSNFELARYHELCWIICGVWMNWTGWSIRKSKIKGVGRCRTRPGQIGVMYKYLSRD